MNDLDVAKRDLAVMVAGVVGYLATRHGDLVAGVYGDAAGQPYLTPSGGELGLERILAGVHDATRPDAAASDLEAVLRFVARTVRRRTILVVVADDLHHHDRPRLGAAPARRPARGAVRLDR